MQRGAADDASTSLGINWLGAEGMSALRSHVVLMFLYALATSAFFALLWRSTKSERIRFFIWVFVAIFFGGIALAWAMYPFPK